MRMGLLRTGELRQSRYAVYWSRRWLLGESYGVCLAYQASLVVYHISRQPTQERISRDWLKHHVNFSSCGCLSMRFEAHLYIPCMTR